MTAARLREAAALMRSHVIGLPGGPWYAVECPALGGSEAEWVVDSPARLIASNIGPVGDGGSEKLAWHIASFASPAVALAAAELLDDIATGVHLGIAKPTAAVQRALALADAYLGSAS